MLLPSRTWPGRTTDDAESETESDAAGAGGMADTGSGRFATSTVASSVTLPPYGAVTDAEHQGEIHAPTSPVAVSPSRNRSGVRKRLMRASHQRATPQQIAMSASVA